MAPPAISSKQLRIMQSAARANPEAEAAFLRALLDATVYAHVPKRGPPVGRLQFVQFVAPDSGQTVLPFFSDRRKAEFAASGRVGIIAMAGRRLFQLTQGATLMLDPNDDRMALYPAEIDALLAGRSLASFASEQLTESVRVGACKPSVPIDGLAAALNGNFQADAAVQAAYVVEIHSGKDYENVSLLVTVVAPTSAGERIARTIAQTLQTGPVVVSLPVSVVCHSPGAPLPSICENAIQFYEGSATNA